MLTKKDYCDYETCVALKELGFKDSTEYYYANNGEYTTTHDNWHSEYTQCWSLYEAQKWLREEKDIHLAVYSGKGKDTDRIWVCNLVMEKTIHQLTHEGIVVKTFSSYEEALSEGIKEAVKILKEE